MVTLHSEPDQPSNTALISSSFQLYGHNVDSRSPVKHQRRLYTILGVKQEVPPSEPVPTTLSRSSNCNYGSRSSYQGSSSSLVQSSGYRVVLYIGLVELLAASTVLEAIYGVLGSRKVPEPNLFATENIITSLARGLSIWCWVIGQQRSDYVYECHERYD